ncbi:phosphatidylinositol-3,5-bisphosphate 5-phosphatase [Coemansia sp. RSA 1285]|nr:phosphatidylinositol-3,5-bisphosphate 5-phosphatase [Coemansia sp. RSA 1804]KAJ2684359.1 phosphatidylinositol-3,5-bisphosphate 5-phosphatase [Coemansia sp. RSA 1285]
MGDNGNGYCSSGTEFPLKRPSVVLTSFDIYENKTQMSIIGSNESEGLYRVLYINRTVGDIKQMVKDDGVSHSPAEIQQLVADIQSKGMKLLVAGVCGIVGFVRFTKGCYISIVTKRRPVALLGGHYVYHVEDTRLLSISYKPERSDAEEKCISRFKNVDLTKNFYYSHTYDITHSLQRNVQMSKSSRCCDCPKSNETRPDDGCAITDSMWSYHSMFVWNYQLMCNATQGVGIASDWTVALIHGYVDQSRLSIFGRDVYITLIARRSRIFAGVRYLKRGINDAGYVANDVETEQIVNTMEVTSFSMPFNRPFSNPSYTAYVQHRGSIPLFWSQDTSGIAPKPPIDINVHDPYFVEAGRHFDNLFHRYGTPIIVLNLIKTKERAKRESTLGEEFSEGLHYLNQFLPRGKKIRYLAWDMSRAKKNRQEDVLAILEVIAEETLTLTGVFHNGSELYSNYLKRRSAGDTRPLRTQLRKQTGVVRSNCIDCLDRTNAAQSIIGKVALAHQLFELGQIDEPFLSFNTDAAMIIEEMYHDLGNTIALQYGGSHLVNTVQTYRRNTNWRSHSRDIVESLRRYYSNSLLDMERQEAITHFVEKCLLPECCSNARQPVDNSTAAELGHSERDDGVLDADLNGTETAVNRPNQVDKPVFRRWWTTLGSDYDDGDESSSQTSNTCAENAMNSRSPKNEESNPCNVCTRSPRTGVAKHANQSEIDAYWNEYYRPHEYSSFDSMFIGTLNSSVSLHPGTDIQKIPSPFSDRGARERKSSGTRVRRHGQQKPKWLKSELEEYTDPTQVSREEIYNKVCEKEETPQVFQPLKIGGWTTDGVTSALQEPRVSQTELEEYEKYVHQFDDLKRWIVPSSDILYSDYVKRNQGNALSDNLSGWMAHNSTQQDGAFPTGIRRQTSAAIESLKINSVLDTDYSLHGDAEQRLGTPVPRRILQMPHAQLPAITSRSYSNRLFSSFDSMPPNSGSSGDSGGSRQQFARHRSNTSSNERGSLWGLWAQNGAPGSTESAYTLGSRSSAHPTAAREFLSSKDRLDSLQSQTYSFNRLQRHDRSRSLDLSNLATSRFSTPAVSGGLGSSNDTLVPEPRVTAADLKIYENFVKMRQAFSG